MCGIAGILNLRGVRVPAVEAMNAIQAHRGPDGEGVWSSADGRCVFGHRRLAIIDLTEAGSQPMTFGALTITYNGEIYNYLEVREQLRQAGHQFHSESDTEVILHAYAEWGAACLDRFNGMFAFAIWNARSRELFCARDRFGEKPFHYSVTAGQFAFASEAKALALLSETDLSIDDGVLAEYFLEGSTSVDSSERTFFRGVRQLLPGHWVVVSMNGDLEVGEPRSYWSIDLSAREAPGAVRESESAAELTRLLTDSVRLRLRSDVTVGSCLSGGLDSSTVVSLIRRLEPSADLRTFTGRFPGDPLDEGEYAGLVRKTVHATGYEVSPTPERFIAEAERFFWHAEFPVGGMSQFAQWCVFGLAKEHGVKVLLDGQGSDEIFGGYAGQIAAAYFQQLRATGHWRFALSERRAWARTAPWQFSWRRILSNSTIGRPVMAAGRRILGRAESRTGLARHDWLREAASRRPAAEAFESASDEFALSRTLYRLAFRTMLSSLLRFGDRLSMAHSREVRLPFCDSRIATFAFGLPPEQLVGHGEVKRVLRLAIRGLVPDRIADRKKQGFLPPQDRWLGEPLSGFVRDLVHDHLPAMSGYLDTGLVRRAAASTSNPLLRWHVVNLLGWWAWVVEPFSRLDRISGASESLAQSVAS